jgi:ferredoxin
LTAGVCGEKLEGAIDVTIFCFTGTGNSLFAARKIGGTLVSIPQVIDAPTEYADDVIGFVFPQYGMGLPKMVRSFAAQNKFVSEYAFAVSLYSYIRGGALTELASLVPLDYGAKLKSPWNFIWAFGAPRDAEKSLRKCEASLDKIAAEIGSRRSKAVKPSTRVGSATKFFSDNKFKVSDACVKCGLCADVCPAGNIEMRDKPEFLGKCEMCFACANLCPQSALNSSKAMSKHRRYRNPAVAPSEIAAANNRRAGR